MKLKLNIVIALLLLNSNIYAAEMVDRVLVIVNEDVITQSEFDYRLATIAEDIKQQNLNDAQTKVISKQLLDTMVSEALQVQETERRGISVGESDVDAAIVRFAAQQNLTVEQLNASIVSRGDSQARFRKSVSDSLNISRLTEFYARSRVVVPEYEIDGWLAQNNIAGGASEYHVARILIKDPDTNESLATQVVDEIRGGLNFQEAVSTYSQANDVEQGGVLGWKTAADLPDVYVAAIKDLKVGDITDVIRTGSGLHILKLLDLKGQREEIVQNEVRHILISASTDVARVHAKKRLLEIKQRIENGESFEALARIFSDDSVSAATGGELGWVSPGDMVSQFEETFNGMPLNEISEPFDTSFGVHILQVLDRRTKNITDQLIRARADNILRRQRTDREFQQWVRELKQESYVQYVAEPLSPS